MTLTYSKSSYSDHPFLSIITRVYKRPQGLANNLLSIEALTDRDLEQIFITDTVGHGLLRANQSFSDPETKSLVTGEYVYLLDDDDFITNPNFITELKQIAAEHDPDIIFFRMIIKNNMNGNLYPTTEGCWGVKPVIARIGGSCFVVKRELWLEHIERFGVARCGDYYFLESIWNTNPKAYWWDKLCAETGSVGRGRPEG